jgi:hypothetical protein
MYANGVDVDTMIAGAGRGPGPVFAPYLDEGRSVWFFDAGCIEAMARGLVEDLW